RFRRENSPDFTQARFSKWWKVAIHSDSNDATILARLNTSDPLLIAKPYGRGNVVLMAAPLDADWSTLPAKPDYVPLLHELIFYLSRTNSNRNVEVGVPLVLPISPELPLEDYAFFGPDETQFAAELAGDELQPTAQLADTGLPGVYQFERKDRSAVANS